MAYKEAELRAKREGQSTAEAYYFLHRSTLLSMQQGFSLPIFQALHGAGLLKPARIDLNDALRGQYRQKYACLSHRWETKEQPDPRGEQLARVKEYLQADPQVEWMWIDYCCMPQAQKVQDPSTGQVAYMRAQEEQEYFGKALKNVNMLYANMQVCILFDRSYNNRFWCLLESILALSNPTLKGLVPSQGSEHHHFLCCGSYRGKNGMRAVHAFEEQWWGMPYVEALEVLKSDDVSVTNQGDKEKQLTALFELQGRIQTLMQHQAAPRTSGSAATARAGAQAAAVGPAHAAPGGGKAVMLSGVAAAAAPPHSARGGARAAAAGHAAVGNMVLRG